MPVKTFRTDPEVDEAVAYLSAERPDAAFSDIVRASLLETARAHRLAQLREESAALAADEDDLAEMRAVMADMEALSDDAG